MILDHGVGYETTTFRTESGYQDFRRPDNVTFVRSLAEDLQRRDFTINALALRENGEVVDLFDGLGDLQRRLIRAVGDPNERFHEDALRMMRAVRFASKLDFVIDRPTLEGINANAHLLAKIAVERIRVELEKMFLGQNPPAGLKDFLETGLYQYCPGLKAARQQLSLLLVNANGWALTNVDQVWALLAVQLGLSGKQAAKFLRTWKTSNETIRQVGKIILAVNALRQKQVTPDLMFTVGWPALSDANQVAAVYGWQQAAASLKKQYDELPIKTAKELAVDGRTLIQEAGLKPGPALGKVLNTLVEDVVNGRLANDKAELLQRAAILG